MDPFPADTPPHAARWTRHRAGRGGRDAVAGRRLERPVNIMSYVTSCCRAVGYPEPKANALMPRAPQGRRGSSAKDKIETDGPTAAAVSGPTCNELKGWRRSGVEPG